MERIGAGPRDGEALRGPVHPLFGRLSFREWVEYGTLALGVLVYVLAVRRIRAVRRAAQPNTAT